MENSLQIATGKRPLMSKGQNALLKIMFDCVRNNEALTFEQLVYCYAENVNSEIYCPDWYTYPNIFVTKQKPFNVIEAYLTQHPVWFKKIRDNIKSWFVSAIGLLVIKGYLRVLPAIDID